MAAQVRAMLPVFWGIWGSINTRFRVDIYSPGFRAAMATRIVTVVSLLLIYHLQGVSVKYQNFILESCKKF